jgi:Fungal specific transcription factor domain
MRMNIILSILRSQQRLVRSIILASTLATVQPMLTFTVYTGQLSHNHFSTRLLRKLEEGLQDSQSEVRDLTWLSRTKLTQEREKKMPSIPRSTELDRTARLYSEPSIIVSAVAFFPPQPVADFLIGVFFEYAQTNYSYVDEGMLRERLSRLFLNPSSINPRDSSWICTMLMIFAIGTQFAHLSSPRHDGGAKGAESPEVEDSAALSLDDNAALTFYHAAKSLMPDVIALASTESVQAFLLLGVYTLPIDPDRLSYTYFGVALRLAILNGMHRNLRHRPGMNAKSAEIRNRIWWTTYTLEV